MFTPRRRNALASKLLESSFASSWLEAKLQDLQYQSRAAGTARAGPAG